jgi:hypothetical protein
MNKIKFFLTIISILISVTPIATQAFVYRENLVGLVVPPEFDDLMNAAGGDLSDADAVNIAGVSFQLPVLSNAHIFPQNNTIELVYTFTNPLDGKITLTAMDAEVVCVDHHFVLGAVSIEPTPLEPRQTLDISVTCVLSVQALEHIATHHKGQDSIKAEFNNFSVELIGVKIHMDHRKLGEIPIKQLTLTPIALTSNKTYR